MKLLIGLGNSGEQFSSNRHNIGFMLIDHLQSKFTFNSFKKKNKSHFTVGNINSNKVILLKPNTYINLSGESVIEIKNFYNIDNNNIFVFHDEIDLSFSKIKVKNGGGNNGHNGLKSVDKFIGKNYNKIRYGIGRPLLKANENKSDVVSNWVLSNFTKTEFTLIYDKMILISKNIDKLLLKDFDKFIINVN